MVLEFVSNGVWMVHKYRYLVKEIAMLLQDLKNMSTILSRVAKYLPSGDDVDEPSHPRSFPQGARR
jgi:hypothetical protein